MHRGGHRSDVMMWSWGPGGDIQAGDQRRTLDERLKLLCGVGPELEADLRTLVEAQPEASLSMGRSR